MMHRRVRQAALSGLLLALTLAVSGCYYGPGPYYGYPHYAYRPAPYFGGGYGYGYHPYWH